MTEQPQKHPFFQELEETHQDVLTLHPLLALLDEPEGAGDDPITLIAEMLARIDARLATIEEALSVTSLPEPVEL
jgi:hypothetical protein